MFSLDNCDGLVSRNSTYMSWELNPDCGLEGNLHVQLWLSHPVCTSAMLLLHWQNNLCLVIFPPPNHFSEKLFLSYEHFTFDGTSHPSCYCNPPKILYVVGCFFLFFAQNTELSTGGLPPRHIPHLSCIVEELMLQLHFALHISSSARVDCYCGRCVSGSLHFVLHIAPAVPPITLSPQTLIQPSHPHIETKPDVSVSGTESHGLHHCLNDAGYTTEYWKSESESVAFT